VFQVQGSKFKVFHRGLDLQIIDLAAIVEGHLQARRVGILLAGDSVVRRRDTITGTSRQSFRVVIGRSGVRSPGYTG